MVYKVELHNDNTYDDGPDALTHSIDEVKYQMDMACEGPMLGEDGSFMGWESGPELTDDHNGIAVYEGVINVMLGDEDDQNFKLVNIAFIFTPIAT